MLKEERLNAIMDLLRQEKYLTVESLVTKLHYSHATIRRDMAGLVKAGFARRSYGGIALDTHETPIVVREHENVPEKEALCRIAAECVNDDDTVFIAGSSTTRRLVRYLAAKRHITVVTQDVLLASAFEQSGIACYLTGGRMKDGMLVGHFARQTVEKLSFDACFFSASGVSDEGEVSVVSEAFGELMTTALARSKKRVCLCLDEKMGKKAFFSLGNLAGIEYLISGKTCPGTLSERFPETRFLSVKEAENG